jgi:2-keto-4-pentenoate hydratase/2-oxohepta-3-ene-1,7-dioic acid hydratase in catechol pathway
MKIPTVPEVFLKPSNCLHDPSAPITLPRSAADAVDAEVELAVVIGRDCKNATETTALEYVLGYTTANDITARDVQSRTSQWGHSKGYDGFCPLGPALVSSKAMPDLSGLTLQTILNGSVLQNGKSSDMIFSIPRIIAHLSQVSPFARPRFVGLI